MNKIKFLTIAVWALAATNLLLVGSMFFHRFGPPPHGRAREMVIRELRLDRAQVRDYDKLIRWHRSRIENAEHRMIELKGRLYGTLAKPDDDKIAPMMDSIGKIQVEIEHTNYRHFQDIRKLCRPDQLENYDETIRHILEIFRRER